jgi:hypothetical protein
MDRPDTVAHVTRGAERGALDGRLGRGGSWRQLKLDSKRSARPGRQERRWHRQDRRGGLRWWQSQAAPESAQLGWSQSAKFVATKSCHEDLNTVGRSSFDKRIECLVVALLPRQAWRGAIQPAAAWRKRKELLHLDGLL